MTATARTRKPFPTSAGSNGVPSGVHPHSLFNSPYRSSLYARDPYGRPRRQKPLRPPLRLQKTGASVPKKSGRIAWITIFIIILCAFISFLSSGGFTLPDSFGSITSDGTYSDPSGESIDWDPYTGVTRDIPADGETYETVLGTGAYKTGIHLPEGVYRAELLAGSGSVSISDRENSIYIHNYFGTEEEYDEIAEMDDLRLYNGADLDVGKAFWSG